ncbi:hypothetical protein HWV62_29324 [Athelia sp. TMB]|nr:hypothetical protein HWV62_29324 [Athelia sp. TMB]
MQRQGIQYACLVANQQTRVEFTISTGAGSNDQDVEPIAESEPWDYYYDSDDPPCGCESAFGMDDDNKIRHYALDCDFGASHLSSDRAKVTMDQEAATTINDKLPAVRVLHGHGNPTIIDEIYCQIEIQDILAISSTCRSGWMCWEKVRCRMFSLRRLLTGFVRDAEGFHAFMHQTGTVIFGRTVRQLLDRRSIGEWPLDVLVESRHASALERLLTDVEGYTRWNTHPSETSVEEYLNKKRTSQRGVDIPKVSAYAARKTECPFKQEFAFVRNCTDGSQRYVRIALPSTCAAKSIMTINQSLYQGNAINKPQQIILHLNDAETATASRVLHEPRNYSVIDNIYDRITLQNVLAVCSTDKRGQRCWKSYRGRLFDMKKLTSVYIEDAVSFQSMLHDTGSVMFGECVQSFMDRQTMGWRPLNIMSDPSKAEVVEKYLLDAGYTQWRRDTGIMKEFTGRRSSRRGLDVGRVSTPATEKNEEPFKIYFTYTRRSPRYLFQYIRIAIPTTCITKSIIMAYESYQMAFMSSRCAVSMYPGESIIQRKTVFFHTLTMPTLHIMPTRIFGRHKDVEPVHYYSPELGRLFGVSPSFPRERSIGDELCWSLMYNEKGEVLEDDDGVLSREQKTKLARNRWTLIKIKSQTQSAGNYVSCAKAVINELHSGQERKILHSTAGESSMYNAHQDEIYRAQDRAHRAADTEDETSDENEVEMMLTAPSPDGSKAMPKAKSGSLPGRRSKREIMPTHCVYNGGRCGNELSTEERAEGMVRYLCRHKDALVASQEAVGLRRALAAERPEAFSADLAESLNNLSNRLSDHGRHEEALAAIQEAVGLRRALAAERPEAFNAVLADSLNNLSVRLSDHGRHEEALAAIQEAVKLHRALAAERPEAFNAVLTSSLNNLSNRLSDHGRHEEALAAIQEAVGLRRALAAERPAAFNADLAQSLNNLSNRLSDHGRHEEALAAIQEAVGLRRTLAAERPAVFNSVLADSLFNLSFKFSRLGRYEEALQAAQEAVNLYRAVAAERSKVFTSKLLNALRRLSECLSASGREAEAEVAREEAQSVMSCLYIF